MQVRHLLMELNRAVCLDHPEENIPWFHEKYCQELLESGVLELLDSNLVFLRWKKETTPKS